MLCNTLLLNAMRRRDALQMRMQIAGTASFACVILALFVVAVVGVVLDFSGGKQRRDPVGVTLQWLLRCMVVLFYPAMALQYARMWRAYDEPRGQGPGPGLDEPRDHLARAPPAGGGGGGSGGLQPPHYAPLAEGPPACLPGTSAAAAATTATAPAAAAAAASAAAAGVRGLGTEEHRSVLRGSSTTTTTGDPRGSSSGGSGGGGGGGGAAAAAAAGERSSLLSSLLPHADPSRRAQSRCAQVEP